MLRILIPAVGALLAVPALVLTLARASGSERMLAIQAQAFAPFAIPLYAVLALLLTGVVARSEDRLLPAAGLAGVLVLLGVHLVWVAPTVRAEPVPASGERLTVMTSNLEVGGADVVRVLDLARARGVDLLALEEVTPRALARLDAAGAGDLFPHRAGPSDGAALDTVVLARTPLADAARLPGVSESWAVTWRGLRVYALHPAYPGHPVAWRAELAALAGLAATDRPDLMLGDLNATRDHRPLRRVLAAGYRDAAEQAGSGWQPTWPAPGSARPFGLPLPPSVAIDHVLLGPGLVAASTEAVVVGGTDHAALLATLVVARR